MANAAWAFVNPMAIVQGAEYWNDQRWQDTFNVQKQERNAADMAYLNQMRPLTLQTTQAAADAQLLKQTEDRDNLSASLLLRVPAAPGESDLSIYQKQVAAIAAETNPVVKAKATSALNAMVPMMATGLANRGLTQDAAQLLAAHNRLASPPDLSAMPAGSQLATLGNQQLSYKAATDAAAAKQAADLAEKMLPEQEKTRRFQAEQALKLAEKASAPTIKESDVIAKYATYLTEMSKAGMTPMTIDEYRQRLGVAVQRAVVNPITGAVDNGQAYDAEAFAKRLGGPMR